MSKSNDGQTSKQKKSFEYRSRLIASWVVYAVGIIYLIVTVIAAPLLISEEQPETALEALTALLNPITFFAFVITLFGLGMTIKNDLKNEEQSEKDYKNIITHITNENKELKEAIKTNVDNAVKERLTDLSFQANKPDNNVVFSLFNNCSCNTHQDSKGRHEPIKELYIIHNSEQKAIGIVSDAKKADNFVQNNKSQNYSYKTLKVDEILNK